MFARVTSYAVKPEHNNEETMRQLEEGLAGQFRAIPGIKQTLHLGGRAR